MEIKSPKKTHYSRNNNNPFGWGTGSQQRKIYVCKAH
jgi:hypothetical protein